MSNSSVYSSELKAGQFISESKNRFLCTVKIDGIEEVCYIASSCRLDNFIDLRGKRVLLLKNKGAKGRTKYSVVGVKYKRSYIILNSSWANKAVGEGFLKRKFSFLGKRKDYRAETDVNGYKADFFIPSSKTLIEVKSVISTSEIAAFPTVYSERTLIQLEKIAELIDEGYKGYFLIVSLNPYVKEIKLIQDTEVARQLSECIVRGLIVKGFRCRLSDNGLPQITNEIPVQI
ncbi:MAG: DNA/RNA nuclease SfsA [Oscillospiraceae bacterium]|nr:DNA/RNA nuclease SfsA [Oscillospiraceae bacterium]